MKAFWKKSEAPAAEGAIAVSPRKKMSRKKKIGIIVLVALVALGGKAMLPKDTTPIVSAVGAARKDLTSRISLSGKITSQQEMRIFSEYETEEIQKVAVEVGDFVKKGEVLAVVRTEELEKSLDTQRNALSRNRQISAINLRQAQDAYDNYLTDLKNNLESETASLNYDIEAKLNEFTRAKREVNDRWDLLESRDEEAYEAEKELRKANAYANMAEKELDRVMKDKNSTAEQIAAAQKKKDDAEQKYKDASDKWADIIGDPNKKEIDETVVRYHDARVAYERALKQKDIQAITIERNKQQKLDAVTLAKLQNDDSDTSRAVEQLEKKLAGATIIAPIDGMITSVNAKEGELPKGVLFTVENTDSLVVKTSVREMEVAKMKEGLPAVIKVDATRDIEYPGKVSMVSPAASRNEDGSLKNTAEFATEVTLATPNPALRAGMNARVSVILEEKKNVLTVPFDTVTTNADGKNIVYRIGSLVGGKATVSPVEVETGMETDFEIEILSGELQEGDQLVTNPQNLSEGMTVKLLDNGQGV